MKSFRSAKLFGLVLAALALTLVSPVFAAADFSISISPTHSRLLAGVPKHVTVTVNSLDSFQGTVSFSASTPIGYTTSFNPTSVSLSSGGSATSDLTITADPECNVGLGTIIGVYGTSGSLQHAAYFTIDAVFC